jgi:hypothetical protein
MKNTDHYMPLMTTMEHTLSSDHRLAATTSCFIRCSTDSGMSTKMTMLDDVHFNTTLVQPPCPPRANAHMNGCDDNFSLYPFTQIGE